MDPVAAALIAIAVIAAALERRHGAQAIAAERDTWRAERAELLTRIQRPEIVFPRPPARNGEPKEPPVPPPLAEVGRVRPLRDDPDPPAA